MVGRTSAAELRALCVVPGECGTRGHTEGEALRIWRRGACRVEGASCGANPQSRAACPVCSPGGVWDCVTHGGRGLRVRRRGACGVEGVST